MGQAESRERRRRPRAAPAATAVAGDTLLWTPDGVISVEDLCRAPAPPPVWTGNGWTTLVPRRVPGAAAVRVTFSDGGSVELGEGAVLPLILGDSPRGQGSPAGGAPGAEGSPTVGSTPEGSPPPEGPPARDYAAPVRAAFGGSSRSVTSLFGGRAPLRTNWTAVPLAKVEVGARVLTTAGPGPAGEAGPLIAGLDARAAARRGALEGTRQELGYLQALLRRAGVAKTRIDQTLSGPCRLVADSAQLRAAEARSEAGAAPAPPREWAQKLRGGYQTVEEIEHLRRRRTLYELWAVEPAGLERDEGSDEAELAEHPATTVFAGNTVLVCRYGAAAAAAPGAMV